MNRLAMVVCRILGVALLWHGSAQAGATIQVAEKNIELPPLVVQTGHSRQVSSVAFSPDGKTMVSGSDDKTLKLWDAATGKELRTLAGHSDRIMSVAFSPDGKVVVSGSKDDTLKLWDAATGKELRTLAGHSDHVFSVAFSPDGKTVVSGSQDSTLKLWDAATGKELRTLAGHLSSVYSAAFSPDGKTVVSGSLDTTLKLWEAATGKELRTLAGHSDHVFSVAFSPDGKTVVSGSSDRTLKLWDTATGKEQRTLAGHSEWVQSVAFSPDGKTVVSGSKDDTLKLWDAATGKEQRALAGHSDDVYSVAFSPDGKTVVSGSQDNTLKLWDEASGQELRTLAGHSHAVRSIAFSPDGKTVASGNWNGDNTFKLWDAATGKEMRAFAGHSDDAYSVAFSPDGKTVVSGSQDKTLKLWDTATGKELRTLAGHLDGITSIAFSPDGKTVVSGSDDKTLKLWDASTGKELLTLAGHSDRIMSVAFSPDGKTVASGGIDTTLKLWRVSDGALLATLTAFRGGHWAVTDPEGRYDSSNAGNNPNLHWVVGMTPIALDQLKARYYEPGLLQKVMGYNTEPLRAVPKLAEAMAHLFPEVLAELDSVKPLQLLIKLRNQGGGYGKVRVRLNGKELTSDARNGRVLKGATETLTLSIAPDLLLPAGNIVDVVAWNAEGYLSSLPAVVKLDGVRGFLPRNTGDGSKSVANPPTLYAIVMGVAHYANPDINLTFSGKDAHDVAQAITLGAKRMFGTDKVQLHLLSDYEDKSAPAATSKIVAQLPSRENLQNAFSQVAKDAKPGDILVVFLAGHGVMSSGAEADYYYLTRDAGGLNLSDPAVRKLWGVSSAELTEWIKQIGASKQMMVLDTCSSGGALQKLTQQRAVPSSQIIALDRLKDRTGFHVLAGAAADKSSLETSRFGQGVLTRALLVGMKGAALRDGEFVDVATLFQYARDEVPKLAQYIGGIQSPLVASPRGESFDIGQMLEADKRAVPLAQVREMMLRGAFQDEELMSDAVKLSARFNQRLRAESQIAVRGRLAFVDADEFPDAWSVAGRYQQTPQGLKVNLALIRNNQPRSKFKLTLKGDENQQVEQLFAAVMEKLEKEYRK